MSILWLIIKWILFILVGILLLLVLVVGLVLVIPIRYEGYFAKYEEMAYEIKIRYLPGVKIDFDLSQGIKRHQVSLFGKKIYEVNEKQDLDEQKKDQNPKMQDREVMNRKANQEQQAKKQATQNIASENKSTEEKNNLASSQKQIEEAESIDIKAILWDPLTYKALKQLLIRSWQFVKIIGPREWDFEVVVGAGTPADTGELIAKLTMLYPLYYRHGIIRGDYEKECLMGGFLVKGRFHLIQIIVLLIRAYLDKEIHAFIRTIKK